MQSNQVSPWQMAMEWCSLAEPNVPINIIRKEEDLKNVPLGGICVYSNLEHNEVNFLPWHIVRGLRKEGMIIGHAYVFVQNRFLFPALIAPRDVNDVISYGFATNFIFWRKLDEKLPDFTQAVRWPWPVAIVGNPNVFDFHEPTFTGDLSGIPLVFEDDPKKMYYPLHTASERIVGVISGFGRVVPRSQADQNELCVYMRNSGPVSLDIVRKMIAMYERFQEPVFARIIDPGSGVICSGVLDGVDDARGSPAPLNYPMHVDYIPTVLAVGPLGAILARRNKYLAYGVTSLMGGEYVGCPQHMVWKMGILDVKTTLDKELESAQAQKVSDMNEFLTALRHGRRPMFSEEEGGNLD